jgi:hypothetical protein
MQKQKQLTQTVAQVQFVPGLRLKQGQSVKFDNAELVVIDDVFNNRQTIAGGCDNAEQPQAVHILSES